MIDPGGLVHERPFTREGNYLVGMLTCSLGYLCCITMLTTYSTHAHVKHSWLRLHNKA